MKISTRSRYGVRALLDIARHAQDTPVTRTDISRREGIPIAFLENILLFLRRKGLVEVTRGAAGGFKLSRPAEQITLLEIVETLEGTLAPVKCITNKTFCKKIDDCHAYLLWDKVYQAQHDVLANMTLKDLLDLKK